MRAPTALNLRERVRLKAQHHRPHAQLCALVQPGLKALGPLGVQVSAPVNHPVDEHRRADRHHLLQLRWAVFSLTNPLR